MIKIYCPNCRRILGDTTHDIDANLNCPGCRRTVHVRMRVATTADYLNNKETNNND